MRIATSCTATVAMALESVFIDCSDFSKGIFKHEKWER